VWAAWVLLQLVKGTSQKQVCSKYGIEGSNLYDLVMHANIMARKMQRLSKEMGWKSLEALFMELKSIIAGTEGKHDELAPLFACSCKEMTPQVARCLWNNNIRDPLRLAETPLRDIAYKLHLNLGFVSTAFSLAANSKWSCSKQINIEEATAGDDMVVAMGVVENDSIKTRDEYLHSTLVAYVSRLQSSARELLSNRDRYAVASLIEIPPCLMKIQLCGVDEHTLDTESDDGCSDSVFQSGKLRYDDICSVNNAHHSPHHRINRLSRMASENTFNGAFVMRHLRSQQHWRTFLDRISNVNCASLQVLFRRIPTSISIAAEASGSSHSWKEFSSSGCLYLHTEDGLQENEAWFVPTTPCHKAMSVSEDPHALAGVGICFGGDDAFFLPLPIPLPLTSFNNVEVSSYPVGIMVLPPYCRELVCCFVGEFDCWIGASPNSLNASNSCLLLNRQWADSARIALRKQWQANGSLAWECLRYLVESPDVTIVGQNLQSQLEALHERGLQCVRGRQYDSQVVCNSDAVPEEMRQRLPLADVAPTCSEEAANRKLCSARRACFRAIAALRVVSAHIQLYH